MRTFIHVCMCVSSIERGRSDIRSTLHKVIVLVTRHMKNRKYRCGTVQRGLGIYGIVFSGGNIGLYLLELVDESLKLTKVKQNTLP